MSAHNAVTDKRNGGYYGHCIGVDCMWKGETHYPSRVISERMALELAREAADEDCENHELDEKQAESAQRHADALAYERKQCNR